MKKILIINGHPDKKSLCAQLAKTYEMSAETSGAECKLINLIDLDFSPILEFGYRKRTELEPDLVMAQKEIKKADHLVFVYPTWWGSQPALLKGFIDRTFLPKFAFSYRENSKFWDKLLKGKTARIITTMDSPNWYYSLVYRSPGHNAMQKSILKFCGVKPVGSTTLSQVKTANEKKKNNWMKKVEKLGLNMN